MSKQQLAEAVSRLPRSSARWLVDRRPTSATVQGQGPYDVVIWVNANNGSVLAHDLLEQSAAPNAIWESFRRAMLEPMMGTPARPRRIQTVSPALRDAVGELAPLLGMEVELKASVPMLDEIFEGLEASIDARGFSYVDGDGVTPQLIEELAAGAAALYDAAPWEFCANEELVEIAGLTPQPLYCTVLGQGGMEYGIGVFFTPEGAKKCFSGGDITTVEGMGILYQDPEEMGLAMLDDIERHGWMLNDDGEFVCLMRYDRPDDPFPREDEVVLAIRIIGVIGGSLELFAQGKPFGFTGELDGMDLQVRWPVFPSELKSSRRKTRRKAVK